MSTAKRKAVRTQGPTMQSPKMAATSRFMSLSDWTRKVECTFSICGESRPPQMLGSNPFAISSSNGSLCHGLRSKDRFERVSVHISIDASERDKPTVLASHSQPEGTRPLEPNPFAAGWR
jgi:hypothetical protein